MKFPITVAFLAGSILPTLAIAADPIPTGGAASVSSSKGKSGGICKAKTCRETLEECAEEGIEFCDDFVQGAWDKPLPAFAADGACEGHIGRLTRSCYRVLAGSNRGGDGGWGGYCPKPTTVTKTYCPTTTPTDTTPDPDPTCPDPTCPDPGPTCVVNTRDSLLSNQPSYVPFLLQWTFSCTDTDICQARSPDGFECSHLRGGAGGGHCAIMQRLDLCPLAPAEEDDDDDDAYTISAVVNAVAVPVDVPDPDGSPRLSGCTIFVCLAPDVDFEDDDHCIETDLLEGENTYSYFAGYTGAGGQFDPVVWIQLCAGLDFATISQVSLVTGPDETTPPEPVTQPASALRSGVRGPGKSGVRRI